MCPMPAQLKRGGRRRAASRSSRSRSCTALGVVLAVAVERKQELVAPDADVPVRGVHQVADHVVQGGAVTSQGEEPHAPHEAGGVDGAVLGAHQAGTGGA